MFDETNKSVNASLKNLNWYRYKKNWQILSGLCFARQTTFETQVICPLLLQAVKSFVSNISWNWCALMRWKWWKNIGGKIDWINRILALFFMNSFFYNCFLRGLKHNKERAGDCLVWDRKSWFMQSFFFTCDNE